MKQASKNFKNVWHAVADANKLWYRLVERELSSSLGLTLSEFRVLRLLSESGSCPMVKLAKDQLMTAGGMTGLVDHLESEGLIERIRSKNDRRVINIEITNQGRRVVERGVKLYQRFLQRSLEDLSKGEVESFLNILNKMISSVQTKMD